MPVLRPITEAEFAAWRDAVIPGYAQEKVRSGDWPPENAVDRARTQLDELLPQGAATRDNCLFTITGPVDEPVGTLWFAVKERGGRRVAYIYDVVIAPQYRRQGHAARAFAALEQKVAHLGLEGIALHVFGHNQAAHSRYVKLGFVETDITMFKPIDAA